MLPLLVAASAAYYIRISPLAEQRLHALGKQTIKQQQLETALTYFSTAAEHGNTSRSHLLLVLHLQRCGAAPDKTRDAFRQAVMFDRSDHRLLQAWALYESKNGNMHRAVHLLRRAAEIDHAALGALRWKRFREYCRSQNPLASPSTKRGTPLPGYEDYGI
jgi:TPR repeat protein